MHATVTFKKGMNGIVGQGLFHVSTTSGDSIVLYGVSVQWYWPGHDLWDLLPIESAGFGSAVSSIGDRSDARGGGGL